jgi:UPF0716 protein FxsA
MAAILLVLLLAVPIIELAVIVQVAQEIGIPETIGLLILVSVAGAWLLKQQGLATWARLQQSLAEGRVPHREVVDGAMILFGGALLLTPGFITDVVGLLLLFPATRALIKGMFRPLFASWAARRYVPPGGVYSARVVRARRTPKPPTDSPSDPSSKPPPRLEPGADDSPDKR